MQAAATALRLAAPAAQRHSRTRSVALGMVMVDFQRDAPFDLDQSGINWVERTLAAMCLHEPAGQLFVHLSMGADRGEPTRLQALAPAGFTRHFGGTLAALRRATGSGWPKTRQQHGR